jgi:carbonic anhydrase/acetyltransferase-like protein (isoleucine patch superfamily)
MKALQNLFDRIVQRVNINLRELDFDVKPYIKSQIPLDQLRKFYAFYGITPFHPLDFQFRHSNLAGSYFLGKCRATNSILYKSDIRGDELKKKGDVYTYGDFQITLTEDEGIRIEDSLLIKTLVHCFSHDPETLEEFFITNTLAMHYANIHGAPIDGSFLGPFATVDLTTMNDCVIGAFSYVQAGEVSHLNIAPGTIWVRSPGQFNFFYRHPAEELRRYIQFEAGQVPRGLLIDFVEQRKEDFQRLFEKVNLERVKVPDSASLDRFALIKPKMVIGENVLVAQRAYLENTTMGKGANAQENCYIINSSLKGNNVTAHGGKIIEADLEPNVFVGFNSFLRGRPDHRISIGKDCVIMPHTIIDSEQAITIPAGHLLWGFNTNQTDIENNSVSLEKLAQVRDCLNIGAMHFEGDGGAFVSGFQGRIHHILETNGAFFDGSANSGHAQKNQNISFNTIQPYPDGERTGLYPTIVIQP